MVGGSERTDSGVKVGITSYALQLAERSAKSRRNGWNFRAVQISEEAKLSTMQFVDFTYERLAGQNRFALYQGPAKNWALAPAGAASGSLTKAGCPTSRSFFARCGIPPMLDRSVHRITRELEGRFSGIPHLAKNERDVGHPALVREPEAAPAGLSARSKAQNKLSGAAGYSRARPSWQPG